MADKFVRQHSTRWAKATVPSYGDDWGDEFDTSQDIEEGGYENENEIAKENGSEDDYGRSHHDEESTHIDSGGNDSGGTGTRMPNSGPSDLVLSIDRMEHITDSDDSDTGVDSIAAGKDYRNDDNEKLLPSVPGAIKDKSFTSKFETQSHDPHHQVHSFVGTDRSTSPNQPESSQQDTDMSLNDQFMPPQRFAGPPRANTQESFESEVSFGSDTDSIQFEPLNISVIDMSKRSQTDFESVNSEKIDTSKDVTQSRQHDNDIVDTQSESYEAEADESHEKTGSKALAKSLPKPPIGPLVLSTDHVNQKYDDSSSESDNWGYHTDTDSDRNSIQEEPLILQNRSPKETVTQAAKVSADEDEESGPQTSHRPLKTDALDSLINDLKQASFENEAGEADVANVPGSDHEMEREGEGETNEKTVPKLAHGSSQYHEDAEFDYSQVTTPISHMSFEDSLKKHDTYVKELSSRRQSMRKPPSRIDREAYTGKDSSSISDNIVEKYSPENVLDIPETVSSNLQDIHLIQSTGSLSTGRITLGSREQEKVEVPSEYDMDQSGAPSIVEPTRRGSTMSSNTISLGGWKPNTGNFRDKFIADNDNDNDSCVNFDPVAESSRNYSKFTNLRDKNSSDESIPRTIDATIPEGDDSLEVDHGDKITFESTVTNDSLLEEKPTIPTFKEESTSGESNDNLSKQRYSSLLGPETKITSQGVGKDTDHENRHQRTVSASSELTIQTVKKPQPYPVFDWKQIMSLSQPIDRIHQLHEALDKECEYDTGLRSWLQEMLTKSDNSSSMHIGKIATAAYQNAPHSDFRRHGSIRSKVSIVKDKVEGTGLHASHFGKKFLNKGRKLMMGGTTE
jgi:hypothetical protein